LRLDPERTLEARERLGLSVAMAAKRADVAKSSISRAEHGEEIRPATARRIATAYGVSVADLYPHDPYSVWSPIDLRQLGPPVEVGSVPGHEPMAELSQEEFHEAIREASGSDEDLLKLYNRLDDERAFFDHLYRLYETNETIKRLYTRAIDRWLIMHFVLDEREINPERVSDLRRQFKLLEELKSR